MKKILFSVLLLVILTVSYAKNSVEQNSDFKQHTIEQVSKVPEYQEETLKQQSVYFTLSCGIRGVMIWDDQYQQLSAFDVADNIWSLDALYCN